MYAIRSYYGNIEIEQKLKFGLCSKIPFSVIYIDIDNFKAYNDVYGFEKGDLIIKNLAEFLREIIPEEQFVGHIGGDDFIIIGEFNNIEELCEHLISEFHNEVKKHYNETDS